jgi:hypothetical protein
MALLAPRSPRHLRSARSRSQASRDLRRNRPLRHRRHRARHRLPPGQACAEISAIGAKWQPPSWISAQAVPSASSLLKILANSRSKPLPAFEENKKQQPDCWLTANCLTRNYSASSRCGRHRSRRSAGSLGRSHHLSPLRRGSELRAGFPYKRSVALPLLCATRASILERFRAGRIIPAVIWVPLFLPPVQKHPDPLLDTEPAAHFLSF